MLVFKLISALRVDFFYVHTSVNKIEAMYEQLGVNAKVVQGSTFKVYVQPSIHCLYLIYVPKILPKNYVTVEIYLNRSRCGSTPVSTILLKLDRFFKVNIFFDEEKTFQLARLHPRRGQYPV